MKRWHGRSRPRWSARSGAGVRVSQLCGILGAVPPARTIPVLVRGVEPIARVTTPLLATADCTIVQPDHWKRSLTIELDGGCSALSVRRRVADGIKSLLASSVHWTCWWQVPSCACVAAIAINPSTFSKHHQRIRDAFAMHVNNSGNPPAWQLVFAWPRPGRKDRSTNQGVISLELVELAFDF